jgi:hypothetical protein
VPSSRLPARSRAGTVVLGALVAGVALLGACTSAAPSFDPAAACTSDARLPGAYPRLEALVPARLFGVPPGHLDSGRNCTSTNLGTLADHGLAEVRFAGGRWDRSQTSGVTLAVFEGDGLTAEMMGEWYEATARLSSKTAGLKPSRPIIEGRQAYRLDLLASEVPQTVICWPSADGKYVWVVIGAGVPESDIQEALKAFG